MSLPARIVLYLAPIPHAVDAPPPTFPSLDNLPFPTTLLFHAWSHSLTHPAAFPSDAASRWEALLHAASHFPESILAVFPATHTLPASIHSLSNDIGTHIANQSILTPLHHPAGSDQAFLINSAFLANLNTPAAEMFFSQPEAAQDHWMDALLAAGAAPQALFRTSPPPAPPKPQRTTPPQVTLFSRAGAFAGAEAILANLAQHLDPTRVTLSAITRIAGTLTSRLQTACQQVVIADCDLTVSSPHNYQLAASILRQLQPNLLHLNGYCGLPLLAAAESSNIPFLQHVHGIQRFDTLGYQFAHAAAIVCVSRFVAHHIEAPPNAAIHTIHNGIPVDHFLNLAPLRPAARQRYLLPPSAQLVLTVSRYTPDKRALLALESFAIAAADNPDLHLLLIGDPYSFPSAYRQARRLVAHHALQDRVHFSYFEPDMRLPLAAADLLLHCAEDDAFPTCILEAMAAGLPVVAANSGGIPEQIHHQQTGLLIEPGNAAAFATALSTIAQNPTTAQTYAAAARQSAIDSFHVRTFANRITELYLQYAT